MTTKSSNDSSVTTSPKVKDKKSGEEDVLILTDLLKLDLVQTTLRSLTFNSERSTCSTCSMAHYEDFADYKCQKLVEGIITRIRQIKSMKKEKLNSLKLAVQTGEKE